MFKFCLQIFNLFVCQFDLVFEILYALRFIEQAVNVHTVLIIYCTYHVCVFDIVNPWYVFVSYTFNSVAAEAVSQASEIKSAGTCETSPSPTVSLP